MLVEFGENVCHDRVSGGAGGVGKLLGRFGQLQSAYAAVCRVGYADQQIIGGELGDQGGRGVGRQTEFSGGLADRDSRSASDQAQQFGL